MAGLVTAFGSGAMTNSIAEIANARVILAIGTNTTSAHPIVALKVKEAVRKGAKLIVVNPKEVGLCRHAHLYLQNKPGSDIPLMMAMMKIILARGLADEEFIAARCEREEYQRFRESLDRFELSQVVEDTGLDLELITEAALLYGKNSPASILYCMGLTQHVHGTDNVWATANLALLTGNIGKESAGVNPLRGQNNVQGACDMGALPDVFPGYKKVNSFTAEFEAKWNVSTLSALPGKTHTEIFDGLYNGEIKTLYLLGENPVLSEANANHAIEAMKRAEFMVVQDIFLSETAELADVVLPAASFAEKDGTFTNTERRVQRIRKAIEPVGDSRPDWRIICELARKMNAPGFDFAHPSEIMDEIASALPNYGGISYKRLDRGSLQWPCPTEDHPGTQFLHKDQFALAGGKARFTPLDYSEVTEQVDEKYPLTLTTDRSLFHFHGTMTRRVFGLNVLDHGEKVKIHPDDARKYGILDGETVEVISRRGRLEVEAMVTPVCTQGTVSMSFHFSETPTNRLTSSKLDPVAKTPGTKLCAVRIRKLETIKN